MHSHDHAKRSAYVVIQKNFTEIWEDDFKLNTRPVTIYEPSSIPKGVRHDLDASSSTYDVATSQRANKSFPLIPNWMKPNLENHYQQRIFQHIKGFDQVFLVGGGIGRWSGSNNFMAYVENFHPHFVDRIKHQRRFRFTNFPQSTLFDIFEEMSKHHH